MIVIASTQVGASRRPSTGSAKQSRVRRSKGWIASSLTLLAMTREIENARITVRAFEFQ